MTSKNEKIQSKVYLEIVEKIKQLIEKEHLVPGSKLPSERELSDQLNVGRSSVREALRALELLGLIETRRGEGTFISDFRNHQLVELLSGFILQDNQAKKDVRETKQLLEIDSLYLLIRQSKKLEKWHSMKTIDYDYFFERILLETDNYLLLKIWRLLQSFEKSLSLPYHSVDEKLFIQLIEMINNQDLNQAIQVYNKIKTCRMIN